MTFTFYDSLALIPCRLELEPKAHSTVEHIAMMAAQVGIECAFGKGARGGLLTPMFFEL